MRTLLLLPLAPLFAACTYVTIEQPPADAQPDAGTEASTLVDAHLEAASPPPDAGTLDAASAPDVDYSETAAPQPGNACPGLDYGSARECGDASSFQVRKNDAGIWTGCSYVQPACPTGWQCAGINKQGYPEFHVCP